MPMQSTAILVQGLASPPICVPSPPCGGRSRPLDIRRIRTGESPSSAGSPRLPRWFCSPWVQPAPSPTTAAGPFTQAMDQPHTRPLRDTGAAAGTIIITCRRATITITRRRITTMVVGATMAADITMVATTAVRRRLSARPRLAMCGGPLRRGPAPGRPWSCPRLLSYLARAGRPARAATSGSGTVRNPASSGGASALPKRA